MNEELQKRTWRVGTVSMGFSLLFLGILLLLSQIAGWDMAHFMMAWWPVIFIVLGIEILLYLYVSRKEKPFLKYDFLSIIFVGVIGTVGLVLTLLSGSGLLEKVTSELSREERTLDLPAFSQTVEPTIKRVVIKSDSQPLYIESINSNDLSLFGTYINNGGKKKELSKVADYLSVHQNGDTLYLDVKMLPNDSGMFSSAYRELNATLLIPSHMDVDVLGRGANVTMKLREVTGNWNVDEVSYLNMMIGKNNHLVLSATDVDRLDSNEGKWNIVEKRETVAIDDEEYDDSGLPINGTYTIGEGTNSISIHQASEVNVQMLKH